MMWGYDSNICHSTRLLSLQVTLHFTSQKIIELLIEAVKVKCRVAW